MQNQSEMNNRENPAEFVPQPGAAPETAEPAGKDEPSLEKRLAQTESSLAEMRDAFLRARAEIENLRRRAQEELANAHKYAIEKFAETLLPVKDSLEMALKVDTPSVESLREGVDMTLKQLSSALEKYRVTEVNPQPGERFDPERHQAIAVVPSSQPPNTVVMVMQKGYLIADRLLRPALVTVAQATPGVNTSQATSA